MVDRPARDAARALGGASLGVSSQHGRRSHLTALSIGGFAIVFGVATIVVGSRVLLTANHAGLEGPVLVPLVGFNVLAGVGYVVAGGGIASRRRWAAHVAGAIAVVSGLAFLALAFYAGRGGLVADRSVVVMTLRAGLWSSLAIWCRLGIGN